MIHWGPWFKVVYDPNAFICSSPSAPLKWQLVNKNHQLSSMEKKRCHWAFRRFKVSKGRALDENLGPAYV